MRPAARGVVIDGTTNLTAGTAGGQLVEVSRADKGDKLGLVYSVHAMLDTTDIVVDSKEGAITPGMVVNTEIITDNHCLIDYLPSPVLRYRAETSRER